MIGQKNMIITSRRWGRWAGLIAAVLSVGLIRPALAQEIEQGQFASFAEELLAGIGSASVEDIPAIGGYGKPRIAVAPFKNTEKTIPSSVAGEYNARLLAELTRQGSQTYRFVARETLREIIHELDTIEELEAPSDSRVADLLRNARVDILIVGALRKTANVVTISYKAVSVEDGIIFAATRPREIELSPPRIVVLWAQRLLTRLGFEPGPLDGRMRPRLRRAIRGYQGEYGLTVDGRMTRRLIRHLRATWRDQDKTVLALP
jgi:hypothetical protein